NALATELFVLAFEPLASAEMINRAMLGGCHEPGARLVGDLGQAYIAHDPRQPGDEPRRLNPPDRVNRSMCVGSDHCYRSQHFLTSQRKLGGRFTGDPVEKLCRKNIVHRNYMYIHLFD